MVGFSLKWRGSNRNRVPFLFQGSSTILAFALSSSSWPTESTAIWTRWIDKAFPVVAISASILPVISAGLWKTKITTIYCFQFRLLKVTEMVNSR